MSRIVVLLSGGLDSAVTLAAAVRPAHAPATTPPTPPEAFALSIDYGQRHRHELLAAARVARQLNAREHRTIRIDLRAFGGSALTADIDVPKDRPASDMASGVPITYVPARNLIFLSLATAWAEVLGAQEVHVGVNAVDYSGYPDCRREFIDSFQRTANLATQAGTEGRAIRIVTPLIDLTKADIIRLGHRCNADLSLTHSCYDPVLRNDHVLACGRCDSCAIRREGFLAAGVPDPTEYAVA